VRCHGFFLSMFVQISMHDNGETRAILLLGEFATTYALSAFAPKHIASSSSTSCFMLMIQVGGAGPELLLLKLQVTSDGFGTPSLQVTTVSSFSVGDWTVGNKVSLLCFLNCCSACSSWKSDGL
jgi:hypothetical protein